MTDPPISLPECWMYCITSMLVIQYIQLLWKYEGMAMRLVCAMGIF